MLSPSLRASYNPVSSQTRPSAPRYANLVSLAPASPYANQQQQVRPGSRKALSSAQPRSHPSFFAPPSRC